MTDKINEGIARSKSYSMAWAAVFGADVLALLGTFSFSTPAARATMLIIGVFSASVYSHIAAKRDRLLLCASKIEKAKNYERAFFAHKQNPKPAYDPLTSGFYFKHFPRDGFAVFHERGEETFAAEELASMGASGIFTPVIYGIGKYFGLISKEEIPPLYSYEYAIFPFVSDVKPPPSWTGEWQVPKISTVLIETPQHCACSENLIVHDVQ